MSDGQWYWCLTHKTVEPYQGCREDVRLGPYATPVEASHALERVAERNEEWDTDPRWNDDDDASDDEGQLA